MTQSNQSQEATAELSLIRQEEKWFKKGIGMRCMLKPISAVPNPSLITTPQKVTSKKTLQTSSTPDKTTLNFLVETVETLTWWWSRQISFKTSWTRLERTRQNLCSNHYMVLKHQTTIPWRIANHQQHIIIIFQASNLWTRWKISHKYPSAT